MQYFDDWNGQFFLHHPFDADSLSQVGDAESFAEIYWEDKIMPYVNPLYANAAIANGGVQVADEKILSVHVRHLGDLSVHQSRIPDWSTGSSNRTSYLMNSQLSHKTIRYGRWTLPRFQYDIGLSNFIAFNERERPGDRRRHQPCPAWSGPTSGRTTTTSGSVRSRSIPGSPGTATGCRTCSILDGHAASDSQKPIAYTQMYPGGQVLTDVSFYP